MTHVQLTLVSMSIMLVLSGKLDRRVSYSKFVASHSTIDFYDCIIRLFACFVITLKISISVDKWKKLIIFNYMSISERIT